MRVFGPPLYAIITGMTRDGAFLIERGEVTRPVKNLRYTQSYLDALRDVQAIGRATRCWPANWSRRASPRSRSVRSRSLA